ncbi:DUF1236 domain-containing protein [Manganibacter manganicus]|uniref:DUF1236 domain-containing protein n=1 Tax=Manganibacter manganicus TaxID=1873176 RepID=A0A1V8RNW0_9HYPH|nr:DUF1236 domain-containing protein [Pseudaminobacter manganicus]OQM74880.1 hypothetical protein BFN67_04465 [Pseudaminobacter manganicus]
MKTILPAYVACAILMTMGVANAQDTVIVPAPQPDTVVIQPEQQTVIREYVHKNPVASVNILGLELALGSKVPDTVELHEVPNATYRYTVIDDQTVIVDPETHEIV